MAAQDYISVVQQLYVSYFGRPADYYGLKNFTEQLAAIDTAGTLTDFKALTAAANAASATSPLGKLINSFNGSPEAIALYGTDNTEIGISKFVAAVYQNVLGREADVEGLAFWVNAIKTGVLTRANAAVAITEGAMSNTSAQGLLDAQTVANKNTVATNFTAAIDTTAEINGYSGDAAAATAREMLGLVNNTTNVTTFQATVESTLSNIVDGVDAGQTFTLTKGLDNLTGTAKEDIFIGSVDTSASGAELNTVSSLDLINGGAGIDTIKISSADVTVKVPTLTSVEVIEISGSGAGVTVDASAITGVTDLNIVKSGAGAITATAAATTNVDVSMKDVGNVTVNGGKDVNVALTDASSTIDVGASGTDAAGAVTITATGKAAVNNTNATMGNIAVGGGKTVNVAQHVGAAAAIVADGTTETITQGNVVVTASSITTDVTVTQDAEVTAASRAAVAGATEVANVQFSALLSGETVTVGGLTFTAAKDLTAAQVAAAFSNLSSTAVAPTDAAATTATGDTQGSSAKANGTFTGSLLANWSTAAAAGDTVAFTGKASTAMTDLVATAKATVTTTTQGVTAVTAKNTLGVTNGTVTIAGATALKTVTVDGFAASTGAAGVTGATNTALDTIKLSNGYDFDIDSAAATLALTLDSVEGTVTVAAGTKTINAKVDGDDYLSTLASASAETVNVSGTGNVAGDTTAGLTAATSINTSGMTAGTATFTIANGGVTAYTGGAGADSVTVTNAGTAIAKAIDLGAGNDSLTLNGSVVAPTATLKGGAGTDTIAMTGASAAAVSANGDFAGKIEGFEKLSINDTVASATTVNMANMDGITYVVSKNSAGTAAASIKEVFTVDLSTSGAIRGVDTIAFNGATVNLATSDTPAQIAQKLAVASYTDWVVTGLNGSVVTFEAKVAGATGDVLAANFTVTDVDATTAAVSTSVSTQGTVTYTLDLTGVALYDTDTLAIGGVTVYTAPVATTLQNTAAVKAGVVAAGSVTIGGVVYNITSGAGNTVVLTTSNTTPAATLAYDATDTGADGNGFVAGAADTTAVAFVAAASEVFAAAFAGSGAIEDGDTIVFDGVTITLASGDTPAQIAAKVAAQSANFTNYTAAVDGVTNTTVNFTAKTAGVKTDAADGNFTITNVTSATSAPKVVVTTTTQGVTSGAATGPGLTLNKMANAGTLELVEAGAGVIVSMADATGATDSFNLVTKVSTANLGFGEVDVAGVETIKFTATDTSTTAAINTATVDLKADKATALTIDGNSNVTLTLDATTTKLVTIDAGALTGKLNVAANGANAMTITGGAGADTLSASTGATAKADVINGGAGKDIIFAGSNGAKLTGGDGNDLFIVTSASVTGGNKESNTYSEITDFKAGDVLQLQASNVAGNAAIDVTAFGKLAATLNETTAVFSDFVNAAVKEAAAGEAVWFSFKGDTYVVVDSGANSASDVFANGDDLIVKLTGISGDNLSWNADFATLALI